MNLNKLTRKELMALPVRDWNSESTYDSVLIFGSKKKHDSGWGLMVVVGIIDNDPVEIASQNCDDINWQIPAKTNTYSPNLRTDCCLKSGILHFWVSSAKFKVGTEVTP
jgi:hypothetical protein